MGILCDGATGFSSLMQGPEKGVNFLTIRVTFKFFNEDSEQSN
jgi:hypothetical protein